MITSQVQAKHVFTTVRLSAEERYLLNGIPEALELQPLSKLQLCHSAMIKHQLQHH